MAEFDFIESFDISAFPDIKDMAWAVDAWYCCTFAGVGNVNQGTIEKFNKEWIHIGTIATGLNESLLCITYDTTSGDLVVGSNTGGAYFVSLTGTLGGSLSLGGAENTYSLDKKDNLSYALDTSPAQRNIKQYSDSFTGSGNIVFDTSPLSPLILSIAWDGEYWNLNSFDNIVHRYSDSWSFIESFNVPPQTSEGQLRRFHFSDGYWYALDSPSGTSIEILKLEGANGVCLRPEDIEHITTGDLLPAETKADIVTGDLLGAEASAGLGGTTLLPASASVGLTTLGAC